MDRANKAQIALAISALDITTQNESVFVIKNHRADFVDAPVMARNEFNGKKGKKGKFLRDWE